MIRETNAEYHGNAAISHSKLETFRRRPALYYKRYITREITPEEPGAAFRLGSAVHCSVLEPGEMPARYAIKPDGIDRRTKDGKEKWNAFELANAGKIVIDTDEAAQVIAMTDAVRQHPLASELFGNGAAELSWRTQGSLPLQCRTDWFNADGCSLSQGRPYIADLKTVESLNGEDFGSFDKAVFKYGYHRQAGFYLPLVSEIIGRPVFDFFFVAVEKCEPFGVAVYRISDAAAGLGQDETLEDLRRLNGCLIDNKWPNIEPTLREIGVPSWYGKGGAA